MPEKISGVGAIKAFFEKDSRPVSMSEIGDFYRSLTPTEKKEFAESAAKQLGLELKSPWS